MLLNKVLHEVCPPILTRSYQSWRSGMSWSGDFESWDAALAACEGYQDTKILARVKEASLAVRDGYAAYERDSVIFPESTYLWPLLSILLESAASNGGVLTVCDFGGALGSTYMQHSKWFDAIPKVHWGIVEQPHFVDCGRSLFENERLRFYKSIPECLMDCGANVFLFSSVLQYLSAPWKILAEAVDNKPATIIIERTGYVKSGCERIMIQQVPSNIYIASYPCRFFVQRDVERNLACSYDLITKFPSIDRPTFFSEFRGLHFQRRRF